VQQFIREDAKVGILLGKTFRRYLVPNYYHDVIISKIPEVQVIQF
jgi:hypothetical protein